MIDGGRLYMSGYIILLAFVKVGNIIYYDISWNERLHTGILFGMAVGDFV